MRRRRRCWWLGSPRRPAGSLTGLMMTVWLGCCGRVGGWCRRRRHGSWRWWPSWPAAGPSPVPPPAGQMPGQVSEYVADEVAAALTLTGRAAQGHVGLAVDLAAHWRTAAALAAGRIDLPKALVMLAAVWPLGAIEAAAIEAAVLPVAGGMTTGELRAWLAQLVLAVDP